MFIFYLVSFEINIFVRIFHEKKHNANYNFEIKKNKINGNVHFKKSSILLFFLSGEGFFDFSVLQKKVLTLFLFYKNTLIRHR